MIVTQPSYQAPDGDPIKIAKINKRTHPNKSVPFGKFPKINKRGVHGNSGD